MHITRTLESASNFTHPYKKPIMITVLKRSRERTISSQLGFSISQHRFSKGYLQFFDLLIRLPQLDLSEVFVKSVHLLRIRHWVDGQCILKLHIIFFTGVRIFPHFIIIILLPLKNK